MLGDLTGKTALVTGQDRYGPASPLGRAQTAEDIGKMTVFLASEEARSMTSQCVHVVGVIIATDERSQRFR